MPKLLNGIFYPAVSHAREVNTERCTRKVIRDLSEVLSESETYSVATPLSDV